MGHAVHYREAAGAAQIVDVPSLDAALELVERLRNDDDTSDVRVFREVPIEVRTYYRVVALEEDVARAAGGPDGAGGVEPDVGAPAPAATAVDPGPDEAGAPEPASEAAAAFSEPTAAEHTAGDAQASTEARRAADAWTSAAPPTPPSGATVVAPPPARPSEHAHAPESDEQPEAEPKRALFNRG